MTYGNTMNTILQRNSEQFRRKPIHEPTTYLYYERKWEWGFLRKQCRNLEMEQFYSTYMQRLRISYLSLFILLQALVGITHVVMLMAAVSNLSAVFVEIFSYLSSLLLVWVVLFITFREDLIKRQPWIAYAASCTAVFILVVSDLLIPIYHAAVDFPIPPLRPSYGSYILYSIYMFIPLSDNYHACILGVAATACYMVNFAMVTYRLDDHIMIKTVSEAIFLGCVNVLGIYFRLMKEIAIRTTILDRRECVEENLLLRYARDQEKSLFLSIIPAQTADKIEREVRDRIDHLKAENRHRRSSLDRSHPHPNQRSIKRWRRPDTEKLFIESHSEVSVLYADIVNYTHLTTTLDVKTLVETIHDLFVKFDQASEEYNVLRIKFLGDCYYCVSGVPVKNDHHAKSCVDLGLRMIKDIREVRTKRKLDIDMRIGVHSGSILSGVIGVCKWQYDIWSKDVDIANRLESTGAAGRVHVSQQTLELLDGEYMYEEGTQMAKEDDVLNKYQIRTYLIKPQRFYQTGEYKRQSLGARRMIESNRGPKVDTSMNFMQNTIEQYNQIRIQAKLEMSRHLDKMPIGKLYAAKICFGTSKRLTQDEMEEQNFRSNLTTICLFFKDWRWEFMYMIEPDVMLKYSILIGFITYFGILSVQAINKPQSDMFWFINALAGVLLTCFLIITWYKKLWIMFNPSEEDDADHHTRGKPKNKISLYFYNLSDVWMRSIFARCFIYLTMVTTLCASSMLQLMDCQQFEEISHNTNMTLISVKKHNLCFNPWAITESLVLTICMNFLFTRIPFFVKFTVGVAIVLVYSYFVSVKYAYIYHTSPSTNLGLNPEYSHLLVIFISFGIFHLMDRQTEYISKVDYNWKRQLQKRQEDAHVTNETIKILVHNILPAHVADIYMSKKMKNEHYFEEYDNVAVMFATIRNYDTEKVGLRVLNEIICDFDEKLLSYQGQLKIEKIKVAGWSYMAACGLDTNRCESTTVRASHRSSGLMPNGRRSYNTTIRSSPSMVPNGNMDEPSTSSASILKAHTRQRKVSSRQSNNVVYVLAQFALDLMKTLHSFNVENLQCENDQSDVGMLRIGMSNGGIMAGVVGSSKPHYDIWGNAVNMASRMDSTGIPGCIQVTEDTAEILMSFDIQCKLRGMTYVKGRGHIPTYIVGIDENLNFIKQNKSLPNSSLKSDC